MTTTERAPDLRFDEAQTRVISHGTGLLLALGGPGSGKTTALVERFVKLACSEGISPDRILMLVPNRAQKMALQDRIVKRLLFDEGRDALIEVPIYTWHGLANHLVGRHYDDLGYSEPPVLLTSPEQWSDVREELAQENPANWPHHAHLLKNPAFVDEVVDLCIRAGQKVLTGSDLKELAEARPAWAEVVRFAEAHERRLRQRARIDYPTLLREATDLLADFDEIRESLARRFLHVIVDDGQELALVQQRMLRFLTQDGDPRERSLVVAADPDSSIETFRGAEPWWLAGFESDFGPHESVTLPVSYRVGPALGDAAAAVIAPTGAASHRPERWAGISGIETTRFANLSAEMDAVARRLRLVHLKEGVPYEDMAILLTSPRTMLGALERALNAVEVPFTVAAPDRPLEREPAVRAVCNLARLAFSQNPASEDVIELLRSPLAELSDDEVRHLERTAFVEGKSLAEVVAAWPSDDPRVGERLARLLRLRDALAAKKDRPADEAFWVVWESADYCKGLVSRARTSLTDPANRELDALVAFARALGRFVERRRGRGTFAEYLEAISRADFGSDPWLPPERRAGGVEVLSFHAAKGREWEVVAVCGVVDGAIPKGRRARGLFDPYYLDDDSAVARAQKNEAEDRRVFYVALTRARRHCLVTTSPGPSRKGRPSRFLEDITRELEIAQALELPPLTFSEAATRHRRTLADRSCSPADRLAALAAIARICRDDPSCSAAQPDQWWWRWDWTEGKVPLRAQHEGDDVPMDRLRTSYSRISEYDNCPLKYLFSIVLGLDPDTSHNMQFGTWIHKVFEEWELGKIADLDGALARYEQLFDETVFPNRAIGRQFRRDGEVMIERYARHLKPGKAALAERKFAVRFQGHLLTGRIDRVDRIGKNVVVSDYKTSRHPLFYDDARKSLQLAIYYLAAVEDAAIAELGDPISMQLIYPGHTTRGEPTKRSQTPDEAQAVLDSLPALLDGVLAEDFAPNTDADCMWCRFKPLCPLWPEGKEVPA